MSIVKGKQLGNVELTGSLYGSASYALTAEFALNSGGGSSINTASFATTGSNTFTSNQTITGSLNVSAGITGSLYGSASYALIAGFALNAGIPSSIQADSVKASIIDAGTNDGTTFTITSGSGNQSLLTLSNSGNLKVPQLEVSGSTNDLLLVNNVSNQTIFRVRQDRVFSSTLAVSDLTAGQVVIGGGNSSLSTIAINGTGSILATTGATNVGITGSLLGTASYASQAAIQYVTNSLQSLTGIEVADFDNNTAVTFVNGVLKFIFGTPTAPSAPTATFNSTFATDRFNKVTDNYDITGSWSVGGYTLISASLWENNVKLTGTTSGTSLLYNTTTTGSRTYVLQVTASSPLDGSINSQSTTLTGTLSKANPGAPTITPTATVQLGSTSNQIEQGATGSISFTSGSGTANSWVHVYTTSSLATPIFVTGSATGSTSISATATSYYSSSGVLGADNSPALTTTTSNSFTYTKIRSLRYGASSAASFTATELENLSIWDTTLGGSIGTISKGTTTATGQTLTITWTGDKYHYIVFNSSLASLTNITTGGFNVFSSFTLTTVGSYKVYRSNTLQAGGAGQSITYVLT
jgi:hypothetical protein